MSWRFRSGLAQDVVFYTDDKDQAFAGVVSIGVYSGGVRIEQVDNLAGNFWRYDTEALNNGGVLRSDLEFRISTYNAGVSSSTVVVAVTRAVLT